MGYEFFEEKIIFSSTLVPGINNDQSLSEEIGQRAMEQNSFHRDSSNLTK